MKDSIRHIIVAQQSLLYKGANLPMQISDEVVNLYKPGTKPSATTVSQTEVNELKGLLISLIEKTASDFEQGIFTTYTELTTINDFHLAAVKDAFEYTNYHEGLHLGYMMAIKKLL